MMRLNTLYRRGVDDRTAHQNENKRCKLKRKEKQLASGDRQ